MHRVAAALACFALLAPMAASGESARADENHLLGEFVLGDIAPARKGEPEIEVSFDIDSNGIVNVSARDLATGREQSITVNTTGTLSEDEMRQIMAENADGEVPDHG